MKKEELVEILLKIGFRGHDIADYRVDYKLSDIIVSFHFEGGYVYCYQNFTRCAKNIDDTIKYLLEIYPQYFRSYKISKILNK